jgi:carbonic anhydrase/acetyltransferase-like protein (isoleucine patch superfamily)
MIRSYKGVRPSLGQGVYVDASAQVIGDVTLGDDASIWMNAVVRGDVNSIRIGACSNVQDNTVIHVQRGLFETQVADHVTIGHSVTLHGCRVDALCLIGIGAIVLNGAHIREESIVAAGSLVPEGAEFPPGSLIMGSPGRVRRELREDEKAGLRGYADNYLGYKATYLAEIEKGIESPRGAH